MFLVAILASVRRTTAKFEFRFEGYQTALTNRAAAVNGAQSTSKAPSSLSKAVSGRGDASSPTFRLPFGNSKPKEDAKSGLRNKKCNVRKVFWKKKKEEPSAVPETISASLKELWNRRMQVADECRHFYQEHPEKAQSAQELLKVERLPTISLLSLVFGPLFGILGLLENRAGTTSVQEERVARREAGVREARKETSSPAIIRKSDRRKQEKKGSELEEYNRKRATIKAKLTTLWGKSRARLAEWFACIIDSPAVVQSWVGIILGLIGWPLVWSAGAASVGAGGAVYLASEVNHLLASQGGRAWLEHKLGTHVFEIVDTTLGEVRDSVREGLKNSGADVLFSLEEELLEKQIEYPSNVIRGLLVGIAVGALSGA